MQQYSFRFLTKALQLFAIIGLMVTVGCKKDPDDPNNNNNNNNNSVVGISIEQGAKQIAPDVSLTYTVKGIDSNGNSVNVSGVSWSSSKTNVAEINSGGTITVKGSGVTTIKASVNANGKTLTSEVPLQIVISQAFGVAPWAVVGTPGFELDFIPYYLAPERPSNYSYTSANTNIATVSSTGRLKLIAAGETIITVSGTVSGNTQTVEVPVLVVGEPFVGVTPPPVTKVTITPNNKELLRGQTFQFSAKAFNSSNQEVNETFTWSTTDPSVLSINSSGSVTALKPGTVSVRATAKGVFADAQVEVYPDTVVVVNPFFTSISAGSSAQFTATVYKVNDLTGPSLTEITNHAPIKWEVPNFNVPGFEFLNVGTVSASGNLNKNATFNVKADAMPGMTTFLVAQVGNSEYAVGGASISVAVSGGGDCGNGNPDVKSISVQNGTTINLSLFGGNITHQIQAIARDLGGNEVDEPALKFNSNNIQVASVDDNGMVTAAGMGTATITICSGSYAQTTVTINVNP